MEMLKSIAERYYKLFNKTGKIEFFMHAKNIEKLNNNILNVDKVDESTNETTLEL